MAPSRLIGDYLARLSAQLPASMVAELADGLDQTRQRYLDQGLSGDAALAEFGDPQLIIAAFTRASPARGAARRLLATGPVVGACWGTALILSRAWTWPVPAAAPILLGTALITVIGLLAAAAFGRRYRPAARAATAGCLGATALDATMIALTMLAAWP
jgi:hypothetical protein